MTRQTLYDTAGRILRDAQWDTATYTAVDKTGAVIETRAVTPVEAAQAQADAQNDNAVTMESQAASALTNNRTYLALSSPTNAQVAAQVRALTQQNTQLIRLVTNQLDATN